MSKKIALNIIITLFVALGSIFLMGCEVLGQPTVCIETQYGKFCYELPEPKGTKK